MQRFFPILMQKKKMILVRTCCLVSRFCDVMMILTTTCLFQKAQQLFFFIPVNDEVKKPTPYPWHLLQWDSREHTEQLFHCLVWKLCHLDRSKKSYEDHPSLATYFNTSHYMYCIFKATRFVYGLAHSFSWTLHAFVSWSISMYSVCMCFVFMFTVHKVSIIYLGFYVIHLDFSQI